MIGKVLDDRYRVETVLATAAGGVVYRGRDGKTGSRIVVRCPTVPRMSGGAEALARAFQKFEEEAALLRSVGERTSGVERLLAHGFVEADEPGAPKIPYCVFEWLVGKTLEKYLAERPEGGQSVAEALALLEPAARALGAAHALGAVHRDVRPANFLFAEGGGKRTMKLTGFSLATRIGGGVWQGTRPDILVTGDVDEAFAPDYAAPEHFKRSYGAVGPATDVYGLALCLVELVTGHRALEGRDGAELYLMTSDLARRPTLRTRGADVDGAVEAVVARAVAVDPKRRWANAKEFWDALVVAVPESTLAPTSGAHSTGAKEEDPQKRSIWSTRPASLPPPIVPTALAPDASRSKGSAPRAPRELGSGASPTETKKSGIAWGWFVPMVVAVVVLATMVGKLRPARPTHPTAVTTDASIATAEAGPAEPDEVAVVVKPFLTDMVRVPKGTFVMGTDKEGKGDRPAHRVTLTRAFLIDRTEVTAEAYAACVEDGACAANRVHAGDASDAAFGCNIGIDPKQPVNCVDRFQAERYCAFAGKRLPSEAEWEFAAKGDSPREYPWGNDPPTRCEQAILSGMAGPCGERKGTSDVGTTAEGRSPFGALDMAGNVWEWVDDGYDAYPSTDQVDPRVSLDAAAGRGILRGGSWDYAPQSAKTTYRLPFPASSGNVSIGFRCARDDGD